MTPPPCDCAHLQTIAVWKHDTKVPKPYRHEHLCRHPSGPHPMNEFCQWRTPKTEGVME